MGIGPTQPAWKASVLPLNYTRRLKFLNLPARAERGGKPCSTQCLTIIAKRTAYVNSILKQLRAIF